MRKLEVLDEGRIPKFPLSPRNVPAINATTSATTSIIHLVRMLIALSLAPQSTSLVACRTKYSETLLERSQGIIRWVAYLLHNATATSSPSEIVKGCCHLLSMLTNEAKTSPLAEELACHEYVADALYFLLCQSDPVTGRYYNFPNGGPGGHCSILSTILASFDTPPSKIVMLSAFSCFSKRRRNEIITSLVVRTEELLFEPARSDLPKIMKDLQAIIVVFRWLAEEGHFRPSSEHGRLMYRFAAALFVWTEKAEAANIRDTGLWTAACEYIALLTRCAVVPIYAGALLELLEAGILPCVVRCIQRVRTPQSAQYLRTLVAYLYPSRIYFATKKFGGKAFWDWISCQPEWDKSPPPAHTAYHIMIRGAMRAYHGKVDEYIDMCNNIKVCHQFHPSGKRKQRKLTTEPALFNEYE